MRVSAKATTMRLMRFNPYPEKLERSENAFDRGHARSMAAVPDSVMSWHHIHGGIAWPKGKGGVI